MLRTHNCGELNGKFDGKTVTLMGWCDTVRDHGNITFVDLRDKHGITQMVLDSKKASVGNIGKELRKEFVIQVVGTVKKRPAGSEKKDLKTGDVEIDVEKVEIIGKSEPIPIDLSGKTETNEDLLLKYRY